MVPEYAGFEVDLAHQTPPVGKKSSGTVECAGAEDPASAMSRELHLARLGDLAGMSATTIARDSATRQAGLAAISRFRSIGPALRCFQVLLQTL
jgi:hypothetical protein